MNGMKQVLNRRYERFSEYIFYLLFLDYNINFKITFSTTQI